MTTSILCLSGKQYYQLMNLSIKTQSFLCSDTVTFIELLNISNCTTNDLCLKRLINEFKIKYYPNGHRENKRSLNDEQGKLVAKYHKPRFGRNIIYKEMEKIAFLRVVRACRDYLLSDMIEEDTNQLVNKIILSHKLLFNN